MKTMRTLRIAVFALGLAAVSMMLAGGPAFATVIPAPSNGKVDDFADTTDAWGKTIVVDNEWSVNTVAKTLQWQKVDANRDYGNSGGYVGLADNGTGEPLWMDVGAFNGFRFTMTNDAASAQQWNGDQTFSICTKRYAGLTGTACNAGHVTYNSLLTAAIGTNILAAGQSAVVSVSFDGFGFERTDMTWWTGTSRLLAGWSFEADGSYMPQASWHISNFIFLPEVIPPVEPVAEPAALSLMLLGLPLALRRRKA